MIARKSSVQMTGYSAASRPTGAVTGWGQAYGQRILNRPPRMPGPSEFIIGGNVKRKIPVPIPMRRATGDD